MAPSCTTLISRLQVRPGFDAVPLGLGLLALAAGRVEAAIESPDLGLDMKRAALQTRGSHTFMVPLCDAKLRSANPRSIWQMTKVS
jgi:hypothetical protein